MTLLEPFNINYKKIYNKVKDADVNKDDSYCYNFTCDELYKI